MMRALKFWISTVTMCTGLVGCAPAGYVYDTGSFVPRRAEQPTLTSANDQVPIRSGLNQNWRLLDGRAAPPISDCEVWKEIDRKIYHAPSTGMPQNDFVGENLKDVHRRGWPEDAAKQLFVVMLAAYSNQSLSEDQFVSDQFKKCLEIAAKPEPKYSNVHIGLYLSAEEKSKAEQDFERVQSAYATQQKRLQPCLYYQAKATLVPAYKNGGIPLEHAQNFIASSAYGPGGIVYRGSQETEALLARLVRAAYEEDPAKWKDKDGRATTNFSEYAFARCMSGIPF
jgi:hypothetical protein